MRAAGIPTAAELDALRAPCVVKADGLAAGKGVFICHTQRDAESAWQRAQALGERVLVEELLEGEEVSVFAVTDGVHAVGLPPAQDFKRLLDGDEGPNTGGMGSYSPVPFLADDDVDEIVDLVHRPVLAELSRRRAPYIGLLYAGLMLTDDGPRVLEFNCRFGDPETQAVLPTLESDLLPVLASAAAGALGAGGLASSGEAAVTVVLASAGYPEAPETGSRIDGVADAEALGAFVFHAGTALRGDKLVSAGGRVLNVTAVGASVAEARGRAYGAVGRIHLSGAHFRTDIALRAAVHVAS
jgi:phosphoribosylamine---glycine ligase